MADEWKKHLGKILVGFGLAILLLIVLEFVEQGTPKEWATKAALYDEHIYACHLEPTTTHATAATLAACAGGNHVPPPPPPPPWW